jgi:hypothetical protein
MGSLRIATQDQALNVHYHHRNIMKQPVDGKSKMCYKAEQMKHIVARCTTLVPSEYTNSHNKVAGYIHWMICKHMGLQVTDKYCEQILEMAIHFNSTTVMWDILVLKDQIIVANQPDKSAA